jgi:hypothetical protein
MRSLIIATMQPCMLLICRCRYTRGFGAVCADAVADIHDVVQQSVHVRSIDGYYGRPKENICVILRDVS